MPALPRKVALGRRGDSLMIWTRYEIHHLELDMVLDVARRDLGHPQRPGLWSTLRSGPIHQGELRCLVCVEEGRGEQWLYLREQNQRRQAVHFNGTIQSHRWAPKSDEHIALQERVATRAEREGLRAIVEARASNGKHVTDVLIRGGGVELGFEAQLSAESKRSTVGRNRHRVGSGIQPLWVGTNDKIAFADAVPWASIPREGAAYIATGGELLTEGGVRRFALERCGFDGNPCPRIRRKTRKTCSGRHLYPESIKLQLDELVVGAATGVWRSLKVPTTQGGHYWWVTADDYERWQEDRGPYAQPERPRPESSRYRPPVHHRPADDSSGRALALARITADLLRRTAPLSRPTYRLAPGRCGSGHPLCGRPARFYPAGWRCDQHPPSSLTYATSHA